MSNTELHDMTAVELSGRFKCKQLSPVEVTKAALARIERLNNHFDAYCFVDREGALDSACASERRWASGIPLSAIDGVPASIKDLCLTKGWPTLRGSLTVDPAGPWIEDAPCTTRLREAGAVLLGKTTTPERGWKGVTDNPRGEVARISARLLVDRVVVLQLLQLLAWELFILEPMVVVQFEFPLLFAVLLASNLPSAEFRLIHPAHSATWHILAQ
jgi:hypothetical protein